MRAVLHFCPKEPASLGEPPRSDLVVQIYGDPEIVDAMIDRVRACVETLKETGGYREA
jgi:hypothetical protein